jgi:hypothetical protein
MTDYGNYLVSDMGGYWFRALERFEGNDVNINQWVIWPPFYHITLTWLFKVLDLFRLLPFKLEAVLFLNIILSTWSVYLVYFISRDMVQQTLTAIIITLIYSFYYPLVYFNAFVLSENLAIPMLIASVWAVFYRKKASVLLGATFFAIAVAVRPNFGILGLPLFTYIAISGTNRRLAIIHGLLFSGIFFSLLALVALENYRISEGRLKGLSANGGVNFYLAQTKQYSIISEFDGYKYVLIPPSTAQHPENGTFQTSVPIYNQKYFYNLGIKHIKENPQVLIENLSKFKSLFFGPLFPSMGNAFGFSRMLKLSQYLIFAMSLLLGMYLLLFNNTIYDRKKLFLISSIPVFLIITHYFFNVEQRYVYSFAFAIFIMFFLVAETVISGFKRYKGFVLIYLIIIILAFGLANAIKIYIHNNVTQNIKTTVEEQDKHIDNIDQARSTLASKNY